MASHREIARDWGCAKSWVDACVKRGCPTDTFENARLWRQAHTERHRYSSRRVEAQTSGSGAEQVTDQTPPSGRQIPEDLGDDLLMGSKEAVRQSWRLLREALIEGKVQKIGAWIAIHTRAVEANVKAESMVREELERKRILIPLSEAQEIGRKVVGVIVSRLNALPQSMAARCDLTDPEMTMTILEEECAAILKDAQQAL